MNQIIIGNMRFTVIDHVCVRMEFSPAGAFRDARTMFASNRNAGSMEFTAHTDEKLFCLNTPVIGIVYDYKNERPKSGTLQVKCGESTWRYNSKNTANLGGPLQSLDGCRGPLPLSDGLLSRDGWHVIDDSNAAVIRDGWITLDKHEEGYFDLYFFGYGNDYKAALKALTKLSGNVPLLPRWSMGSWYSRWYQYTSKDYRNIVNEYVSHGFPLDVIVMDMEWHTRGGNCGHGWGGTLGWTGWSWNRELLPDAESLLRGFRENGLHIAMNVHPHDGIRSHETCYDAFMSAMGENTVNGRALKFDAGNRLYMENYFKYAHVPREIEGCSVWWVDWQQDSIYPHINGIPGTPHVPWLNTCYFNHMKTAGRRGIAFSRWGGFGDQKHPIHFSGDTTSSWDVLAYQISFTAISGNSGCFFWTHDMGGFCGERQPELYARWLQFGSLSAAMRLHSAGDNLDRRPWKWESPFRESMKKSFQLRAILMPYLYTAMRNACHDSVPMIKPLYIEYPRREEAYDNPQEFLTGDFLLAAPIVTPGEGSGCLSFQKIWIPDGEWFQFFTGERVTEGEYIVAADINEMPLFVRAGVPIPLGDPEKIHLGDPDTSFNILLFPAFTPGERQFVLYEDDGESDAYEHDAYTETVFSCHTMKNEVKVIVHPSCGQYDGMIGNRSFKLELHCVSAVKTVKINSIGSPFCYDAEREILFVGPIDSKHGEGFTVEVVFVRAKDESAEKRAYLKRAKSISPEQNLLLHGSGVLAVKNPLNSKRELFIWPNGLTGFLFEHSGTKIKGNLQSAGNAPLRFEYPSWKMTFEYGENKFLFNNE